MHRLLERAVHEQGAWQIEIAGVREDAVRVRTPNRVLFLANFYGLDEPYPDVAWLLCGGEIISSKDITLTGTGPYAIEWSIVGPDSFEPHPVA